MKLPLYWVDAFSDKPFAGNPAAVVPLERWLPDDTMQRIAFENGLAETAFFVPLPGGRFHLRWFTPAVEVELCGHATLATAHVLFTQLGHAGDRASFGSLSGTLDVARRGDGMLELDFPSTPPVALDDAQLAGKIADAIGADVEWIGKSPFDLIARLSDADTIRSLKPDFRKIESLGHRGLVVTAESSGEADFVSRFFAPQSGIDEDPVTGSAHCALIPLWADRLGKTRLGARQASPRGGDLLCELRGDRVGIAGHATLYLKGEIHI